MGRNRGQRQMGLIIVLLIAAGSAATRSTAGERPGGGSGGASACPVSVLFPVSSVRAFSGGNIGFRASDIESLVADTVLEAVRQECPRAELARPDPASRDFIPGYIEALQGSIVTPLERSGAAYARGHGASYLLVPTIERWDENRTDDPIGAFIGPKNRVAISLRLMRLADPAVVRRIDFTKRSRITFNQPARRLLGKDFQKTIKALLRVP